MANEKRNIKINHDTQRNKVVMCYENIFEIDLEQVPARIKRLTSQIAQMEFQYQQIVSDIENTKKELDLLRKLIL